MEQILIFIVVLIALVVVTNCFSSKKKPSSGNCRNCPEYRYCGGGRPRCARRHETNK